ncbi:hypothetical protein IFR05_006731 [Cadophora sp. M221]|nr:hypothetical protein IFR05_006731 [Cadophora sp. M221]
MANVTRASRALQETRRLTASLHSWAPRPKPLSREDILKAGSTATVPETLPSWIPLIEKSAFGEPHGVVEGRVNGDSFVGGPERRGQQKYNASLSLPAWHQFGKFDSGGPIPKLSRRSKTVPAKFNNKAGPSNSVGSLAPLAQGASAPTSSTTAPLGEDPKPPSIKSSKYDGTLTLKGFCLDVVEQVSNRVAGGKIISDDALLIGGWDHKLKNITPQPTLEDVPEKLWRTLVADRGPNGTSAPGWYRRACFECLQHTDRGGDLDLERLKLSPETSSTQATFLERVQPIVWGRRFFETEGKLRSQKPLFGLGNSDVRIGDKVCILFGCSVPVLLRQKPRGKDSEFLFIGECYVHGMMDGEAITSKFGSKHPQYPYYKKASTFKLF